MEERGRKNFRFCFWSSSGAAEQLGDAIDAGAALTVNGASASGAAIMQCGAKRRPETDGVRVGAWLVCAAPAPLAPLYCSVAPNEDQK